ncbi:MAG TPA: ornithine cyclodeaminase [Pseudomonadales bacterium]|nr:ornithine cyclodeaminase [Pseudomonadales bacterium]
MTRFLDTHHLCELVNTLGVPAVLRGIARNIEQDFLRWNDFDKSARTAAHSDDGVIELMPVADDKLYAFKYVNGHPINTARGLSTVMAFGALADVRTGQPLLLSELTLTTGLRTAATSAVAARALARPDSRVLALIGCGAQAEFQALAFHHLLGIDTIRVHDIDGAAVAKLERNLADVTGLRVLAFDSTAEAVRGADIITTCTADKAWATILDDAMIEDGVHINAIGGDCPGKTELHADVLRRGTIFVEYEPQTRIEGDIQQLPAEHEVQALWEVLSGARRGRTSDTEVTIFDSVGFALEDYSALRYMYDEARRLDLGEEISLVPELADPKDLFSLLRDNRPAARSAA